MQILEAFRALNALNEDTFALDADGIKGLSDFKNNDDFEDDISIIDPEAETEEELQDNYIGKVILDCCVCHSKLYKAKEEVTIDEEDSTLANVGEECPYCFTPDGFRVIGEVTAFDGEKETEEEETAEEEAPEEEPVEDKHAEEKPEEEVEESLKEGIFDFGKKKKAAAEKARREAEEKKAEEEESERRREASKQQDTIDGWRRYERNKRDAESQYRNRKDRSMSYSPSNTAHAGVNYSGGDYFTDSLDRTKKLGEGIEDLSMTANDTHIEVGEDETGKVTVTMEPVTADGGEMISPVSPETEAEIMASEEEIVPEEEVMPEEGMSEEEVDIDVDEFDEESMDELGESYFKRVYENVNGFRTSEVKQNGNSLVVEGKIKFNNGKVRKTSFMFEALDATKAGKVRFVGDNKNLTEGKKAFMLTGRMNGNKLIAESLNYNYKHKDAEGKVSRVYGTERISRR